MSMACSLIHNKVIGSQVHAKCILFVPISQTTGERMGDGEGEKEEGEGC